jgi:hypothetical protein
MDTGGTPSRFDPDLASTYPMCAQAWAAEPQALYDWPALLTTEGDTPYEDVIPDGEICSAGLDKHAAFDEPGDCPRPLRTPHRVPAVAAPARSACSGAAGR